MKFFKNPFVWFVMLVCVLGAVSISIYNVREHNYAKWQTTTGTVLECEQVMAWNRFLPGEHLDHVDIHYTYTVNGQLYKAVYWNDKVDSFSAGSDSEVWYNPDNPSESSLSEPQAFDVEWTVILFVLIFCFAYKLSGGFLKKRNNK